MTNPYKTQPSKAFWRQSIADVSPFDIGGLWDPKFAIKPKHKVSTYGSCFAQHIGRALNARGFNWFRAERPAFGLSEKSKKLFNYDVFSSRTANIYTTSLLLQWINWSLDAELISDEVWEKEGRYIDPFRPVIEPDGFASVEEVQLSRAVMLEAFKRSIVEADYFVFTLGLTERWVSASTGLEYPMCPGTAAGEFDETDHQFHNMNYEDVKDNLLQAMELMKSLNPDIKFILTVSPVPLTATATNDHVLVATTKSKSILRAVAGFLKDTRDDTDYFPSFEIISSTPFQGMYFEPNKRSVNPSGVAFVMDSFFKAQEAKFGPVGGKKKGRKVREDDVCEEALLDAFGGAS